MSMREAGAGTRNYRGTAGYRDNQTRLFRDEMRSRTQDNFETSSSNQARSQQNSEHARKAVEHAKQVQTQVQQTQTQPPEQKKKKQGDMVIETPTQAREKQRAGEGMVRSADFRDKNGNGTDDRDEGGRQKQYGGTPQYGGNDTPQPQSQGKSEQKAQIFADKYKLNLINSGATK